jgi:DNA-binding SARP family transcriptional activator
VVIHASNEHLDEAIAMLCVSVAGERSTLDEPRSSIRVALLRADVTIDGLSAPFNADLRRRCVEMTAYLALHRHQAVSGDRLRIRVLGGPDTDASLRTLSNTASAIRKSLGVSGDQTRLLPVGPSGHYRVIDVSTDVEECHRLIAEAKSEASDRQVALLRDALALIEGEPLTAESRGYEWFVAEGHMARLIRDVEWAVTQLIEYAKSAHDQDLAWWARDKGRLVDPWKPRCAVPSRRDEY